MGFKTGIGARLGLKGSLEFRNNTGEVIKTVDMNGSFSIDNLFQPPGAQRTDAGNELGANHEQKPDTPTH